MNNGNGNMIHHPFGPVCSLRFNLHFMPDPQYEFYTDRHWMPEKMAQEQGKTKKPKEGGEYYVF